MTPTMKEALFLAARNGAVWPGNGNEIEPGGLVKVNAMVIKALAARGLLTLQISPEGGAMGVLTEAGKVEVAKS